MGWKHGWGWGGVTVLSCGSWTAGSGGGSSEPEVEPADRWEQEGH